MKIVAITLGIAVGLVGMIGVVAPSLLLEAGRALQTPATLYVVAAVRVAFGAALVGVAAASRMPKTVRVLGVLMIVVGVLTPFLGVERSRAALEWWSAQGPTLMRVWAGVAVAFGLFIVYVLPFRR